MTGRDLRWWTLRALALAGIYFVAGSAGLRFDAIGGVASAVWPPTGIALAALLWDPRLWPAIAVGAFFVNLGVDVAPLAALGIAAGNTLEAVVASALLRRARFQAGLERVRDVLLLVTVAGLGSTLLSATIGAASLWLVGLDPPRGYPMLWLTWWIGDVMADWVLAPAILVSAWAFRLRSAPRLRRSRVERSVALEATALAVLLVVITLIVFTGLVLPEVARLVHHVYFVFPPLIWAALRFGPRGAATSVLVVAGIAIACTSVGVAPFVKVTPAESYVYLQTFLGIVAVTVLLLGAASAERRRAVELREEFLSLASHELRTPLTSLSLRLDRALRLAAKEALSVPDFASLLRDLRGHTDRLAQLTDRLLDASQIHAGRLVLHRTPTFLDELARTTAERLSAQASAAGCAVELKLERLQGSWDAFLLGQVVTNLLVNATKYGGGQPITLEVTSSGNRALLSVTDRGPGIGPGDQERIFRRFERGGGKHEKAGGLGLGLYIAREIVEAHGGRLELESQAGRGSTFLVSLPLDSSLATAPV